MQRNLAIANCRVSSDEQLLNNSLNRQKNAVLKAAEYLEVRIPDEYWWSGSVSSKKGTNIYRKDLKEMEDCCKKDKRIKYLIVDEPDRFMRSIDEAAYFEVTFRKLGVTVWYASDPELNKGDLSAKLLKFTKYLSAEGSNEERQQKSISGLTTALREGRYPFPPKAGYVRGFEKGIHEIDKLRGPSLKKVLERLANHLINPTEAVKELNDSVFSKNNVAIKMDKFRIIATDPYYAGIVEMNKQVQFRNENGLHVPLITREQHFELINIMENKKKNQKGPRKGGNPKFPLSNLLSCDSCRNERYGRFVGFTHSNGRNPDLHYDKYRCRSCKTYLTSDSVHKQITSIFDKILLTKDGINDILKELNVLWKEDEKQTNAEIVCLSHQLKALKQKQQYHIDELTDPSNISIKEELRGSIERNKSQIEDLEEAIKKLDESRIVDKKKFLKFAYNYINNLGENFLNLPPDKRMECKQILFPQGFFADKNKKVYTTEISPLYRWKTIKKDAEASSISLMVRVKRL